ncbi:MAG: BatD family protein [Myxococcota bacterium]
MRALGMVLGLALALATVARPAEAQPQLSVEMTTDRSEVSLGETFVLQVRATVRGGRIEQLEVPDLSAFDVISQRSAAPMQFGFGSGGVQQLTMSQTQTYRLRPLSAGSFALKPARVFAEGTSAESRPVTVVVSGGSAAPAAPPGGSSTAPAQPTADVAGDGVQVDGEAFLRTTVDVAEPYVGQQVTATIYLYTRAPLRAAPTMVREASVDGFWAQDLLPPARNLDAQTQVVQGVPFRVYMLRRYALFPLRAGELTVGAPEAVFTTGSAFGLFGRGGGGELRRQGVPVTLRARALPPPAPAGAVVGDYRLDARLDRTAVRTRDAVTLTASLQARRGNVRDVRLTLPSLAGVRVLEPRTEDEIRHPGDVVGGTRRVEWLLVPEQPGRIVLPRLSLQVFDPESGRYTKVEGPELALDVAGAATGAPTPAPAEDARIDDAPEAPAPDALRLGPVRRNAALTRRAPPFSSTPLFWALLLGLPALLMLATGAQALRRRHGARGGGHEGQRISAQIERARGAIAGGDARGFYGALSAALAASVERSLGRPVGALTHDALRRELRTEGMDEELVRRVIDELDGCDFARFSSAGGTTEEMRQALARGEALMNRVGRFRGAEAAS